MEGEPTAFGKKLDYDCVLDCRGYNFLGPKKYMTGELANCLDTNKG